MQVFIGSDHAGCNLKEELKPHLKKFGLEVEDLGVFNQEKADYPDIAKAVAEKVASNEGSRGVLICGSGVGMSMAANKVKGIRAAQAYDVTVAKYSRLHNDANVLCLGERMTGVLVAKEILDVFMMTEFEGGRHEGRVQKITDIENA
ncbi:ribose 5-phosphate isomerase B [Patescibacteria group bacterium]|nr:ribose 5-phosphate isomerase B [Patescibacteria group bacterium]